MRADEVVEIIQLWEQHSLEVYVDGGWAVDALLGQQTRAHDDLDIAIPQDHVPKLRELLSARGYREEPRAGSWECNFVLVDASRHQIDVHSYTLDEDGNNIGGVAYRREHLTGKGCINGYTVRCISPQWLVKFHCGYQPDENDYRDVRALCERFAIALPDEYRKVL